LRYDTMIQNLDKLHRAFSPFVKFI